MPTLAYVTRITGTDIESPQQAGVGRNVTRVTLDFASTAGGVASWEIGSAYGILTDIYITPDGVDVPTDNFDLTITNDVASVLYSDTAIDSAAQSHFGGLYVPVAGEITIAFANMGDTKKAIAEFVFVEPTDFTAGDKGDISYDAENDLLTYNDGMVDAAAMADDAVETDKILNSNVTYAKIQNVTATDKLLGRSTAGAGVVEEIACTAAGRALLDDAAASNQRTTLGLKPICLTANVETPTAAMEVCLGTVNFNGTISKVTHIVEAATNVVFNLNIRAASAPFTNVTAVWAADKTATTTTADETTFTADDIDGSSARKQLWLTITSVSGTPGNLNVIAEVTRD